MAVRYMGRHGRLNCRGDDGDARCSRSRCEVVGAIGFEPATFWPPAEWISGVYPSRSVRRVLCVQGLNDLDR